MKLNPFLRYAATHYYFINKSQDRLCLDCRLFYVENGNGSLKINDTEHQICSNTVIYMPPQSVYNFNFDNKHVKIHVLNFDLVDEYVSHTKTLPLVRASEFDNINPIKYDLSTDFQNAIVKQYPTLLNKINACVNCFNQKDSYYNEICSAELKLILIKIIKTLAESSLNSIIKSVIDVIKKEYKNSNLTNDDISSRFNYHSYHLNKIFKQETGVSLHKYLTDYRLDMAKYYLSTTPNSITEIAEMVGFANYSYFIKVFRERYNVSPLKYKKKNLTI